MKHTKTILRYLDLLAIAGFIETLHIIIMCNNASFQSNNVIIFPFIGNDTQR